MRRVLGPKAQERIYRWPVEAQRRQKNMQRMRRSPHRKRRTVAMLHVFLLARAHAVPRKAPKTELRILPSVLDVQRNKGL